MAKNDDLPWFVDGLRFTCTQCGKCCMGFPGYVWVNAAETKALADRLGVDLYEFEERYTRTFGRRRTLIDKQPDDACIFWEKDQGCTVYEDRPRQCRTWPFWESNIETPEDWVNTCRTCPGSGKGKLHTVEEILAASKRIRL
ncbi:MAG: YkgJ family cysteine cluster protein [Planctomycetia bacterium]